MRISGVRCHLLSCPLRSPLRISFPGGVRTVFKRDAMIIRVEAAKGLAGYAPGPADEWAREHVETIIAPFLEGRELGDPDALRVHFLEGPGSDPRLLRLYCAAEIALFDLLGKARDLPVSELLGGRVRDRIRVYASAAYPAVPERFAEEAHALASAGFRAYKIRAGLGPLRDAQSAELVRKSAGQGFDLMIDAQAWWRTGPPLYSETAKDDLISELTRYGIAWLEEPLPAGDHEAWRRLRELAPLAGGSHASDEAGVLDLLFNDTVDYVQMDLTAQGGFWAARRILPEVAHAGVRFAFHGCATPLEAAAAAQLGVCWPEMVAEWLEYPTYAALSADSFPLATELVKQPLEVLEGSLIAPRGPGLGVIVDERVFDRYRWLPGPSSSLSLDGAEGAST